MPSPSARSTRSTRSLLAVGVLSAVATGCGAVAASAAPSAAHRSKTAASTAVGTVLNVGDQEQTLETLFQASGVLKGAKYKVNFVEFDSGPLVDAGFAAHKIDLGSMGDLPASLAAKSGLPVKAIAVDLPIGASEFLLAQPGITSIAQLKGKPVAYTTGTSEQAFALRALASAGLGQKDVRQVNVALQQLGTVLESGAADASVVSVEQKIDYQATHPSAKVLADVDTVTPPSYGYLLGTTAALSEPAEDAAVKDFTARLLKANEWRNRHPGRWVQDYYVAVEHQTTAAARQILAAGGTDRYVPITASVRSALQKVVGLLAKNGVSPSYSVAPLFSTSASDTYNAILKEAS